MGPATNMIHNIGFALLAAVGGWFVVRDWANVGLLLTFFMYAREFGRPITQLGQVFAQIQSSLAGAERVFEIMDEVPEIRDEPDAVDHSIRGEVSFRDVNFGYLPGVPVLKGVTLTARPGQTVALVGPTGAGKTTIVNLLTRFYDIQTGRIEIDGLDIRRYRKNCLRSQLGIVLQDTYLFAESVMENIRYGRLSATDEEVRAAAVKSKADQFIHRLPDGYETMLTEEGGNLSQGQRQLLAISRAMLADPAILILDEATSSVDTRTEVYIQQAMLELMRGRTSFVIAHRLSTIRKADLILVIDGGRIVERGTHEELLAAGGFYSRLYLSQFAGQDAG
jgi:ATP-binding cassette subfamily B protein